MINNVVLEDIDSIINHKLDWSKFDNTTVLISGANGCLPAYLVETLLRLNDKFQKNIKVVALVRNKEKAMARFSHHKDRSDLQFLVQDVNLPVNADALGPVDYIIHAASQATPKVYGTDPVGTMLPNILGTQNLLELVHKKSARGFLFFSSGEVYGETNADHIPTREDFYGQVDPTQLRSCYGESKRAGETLCVSWHHQYGVPAKIIRLFHTYGPGMDLNDGRVFADFVSDVLNHRDIVMKSDGKNTRAFCYIADAMAGAFTVLLEGKAGEAYNVGYDKETSIVDLANILVNLFPEKKLKLVKDTSAELPGAIKNKIARTCPDIGKVRELGWNPEITVTDGFRRTILSYL